MLSFSDDFVINYTLNTFINDTMVTPKYKKKLKQHK